MRHHHDLIRQSDACACRNNSDKRKVLKYIHVITATIVMHRHRVGVKMYLVGWWYGYWYMGGRDVGIAGV